MLTRDGRTWRFNSRPSSDRPKYEGLAVVELTEGILRGEVRTYLHFEENVWHVFSRLQYG